MKLLMTLYLASNERLINWRAFKKLFFKHFIYCIHKHFVYHSVIVKSFKLGVTIKGIASNCTLPFNEAVNDGINKCKLLSVLNNT